MTARLRLGTRGSPLALAQAELARAALAAADPALAAPDAIETVILRTTGDRVQDRPLAELGGKGLFAKEIEEALLDGRIDIAVHSLKDLPSWLPDGLILGAVLAAADPRDALVTLQGLPDLAALPQGAVVGTCSPRRQAQLLMRRPDLTVVPLRGNIGTRLAKLQQDGLDATLLAMAGLGRLGLAVPARPQAPEVLLPAVAQGVIGLEQRADDAATSAILAEVNHAPTWRRITAERACLEALEGGCNTPVAVYADTVGDELRLRTLLVLADGREPLFVERQGSACDAAALGRDAGAALRALAGPAHLALLEA